MKHLLKFETEAVFDVAKSNLPEPWVTLTEDDSNVHFMENEKTEPSIQNNEIWYTTTDGNVFNILDAEMLGLSYEYTLLSNTYENGKGVMVFDQPIIEVGTEMDEEGNPTKLYPVFANIDEESESTLLTIVLPDSVTTIGNSAFGGCSSLTGITIPDSVTSIGNSAFHSCSGLTSVTIPDSVTSIGEYAFDSCSGLTSVIIGNSVTSIGFGAFQACINLTSITIPYSVESIDVMALEGCLVLTNITFNGTIEQWKVITKGNSWHMGVPATSVTCSDGTTSLD